MKPRRFQPVAVDALEDRLVMTAFAVPFSLVTPPPSEVNPKFLNLTGRTTSEINSAISSAFNRFTESYVKAFNTYKFDLARDLTDPAKFNASVTSAFNRLSSDLLNVSRKVPFGGVNLNPVLQGRIIGAAGVTDTTTNATSPSLQSRLAAVLGNGTPAASRAAINAIQSLVRTDVNNYINLGVTNNFFRLTRGASLPRLS